MKLTVDWALRQRIVEAAESVLRAEGVPGYFVTVKPGVWSTCTHYEKRRIQFGERLVHFCNNRRPFAHMRTLQKGMRTEREATRNTGGNAQRSVRSEQAGHRSGSTLEKRVLGSPPAKLAYLVVHECAHAVARARFPRVRPHGREFYRVEAELFEKHHQAIVETLQAPPVPEPAP